MLRFAALVGYWQLLTFMRSPNVKQNTVHKTADIAGALRISGVLKFEFYVTMG